MDSLSPLCPSVGVSATSLPVGREAETAALITALTTAVTSHTGARLYVSGVPGTGKSLCVDAAVAAVEAATAATVGVSTVDTPPPPLVLSPPLVVVKLNCASLPTPAALYPSLLSALADAGHPPAVAAAGTLCGGAAGTRTSLGSTTTPASVVDARAGVRAAVTTAAPRPVVVVLDEVDFLCTRDQRVLTSAFEWPLLASPAGGGVSLVAIANRLDLPARLHPWLRARGGLPTGIPFRPYDATALKRILGARMEAAAAATGGGGKAPGGPLLDGRAMELVARKVAAASGDCRVALDICRSAVLVSSDDTQGGGGGAATATATATAAAAAAAAAVVVVVGGPLHSPSPHPSPTAAAPGPAPASSMTTVAAIFRRHGGVGSAIEAVRTLPSQQQVLLAALAAALSGSSRGATAGTAASGTPTKTAAGASVPLDVLHARYVALARRLQTSPVSFADAVDMVGGALASTGLVRLAAAAAAAPPSTPPRGRAVRGTVTPTRGRRRPSTMAGGGAGAGWGAPDGAAWGAAVGGAAALRRRRVSLRVPLADVQRAMSELPLLRAVVGVEAD
ncbi:hypothetical protein MMPV_006355 [Pyropia vietnamensis]